MRLWIFTITVLCSTTAVQAKDLNGYFMSLGAVQQSGSFNLGFQVDEASFGTTLLKLSGNQLQLCAGKVWQLGTTAFYAGGEGCVRYGKVSGTRSVSGSTAAGQAATASIKITSDGSLSLQALLGYTFPGTKWSAEMFAGATGVHLKGTANARFDGQVRSADASGGALGEHYGLRVLYDLGLRSSFSIGYTVERYDYGKNWASDGIEAVASARYEPKGLHVSMVYRF